MPKQPALPPPSVPPSLQPSAKFIALRNVTITLVSLTLAALWIAFGPHGDFLDGRAFTVSTVGQITYVFYNWSISLPLDPGSEYHFQARNTRLVGHTNIVPVDSAHNLGDPNKIIVNIETTARPDDKFTISPWGFPTLRGFTVVVDDNLPNPYGIEYANVTIYLPRNLRYKVLSWTTYPQENSSVTTHPSHKWSVHLNDLEAAGMHFEKVDVNTDSGDISVDGLIADAGSFKTIGGTISGNYTIPDANLTLNSTLPGHQRM